MKGAEHVATAAVVVAFVVAAMVRGVAAASAPAAVVALKTKQQEKHGWMPSSERFVHPETASMLEWTLTTLPTLLMLGTAAKQQPFRKPEPTLELGLARHQRFKYTKLLLPSLSPNTAEMLLPSTPPHTHARTPRGPQQSSQTLAMHTKSLGNMECRTILI